MELIHENPRHGSCDKCKRETKLWACKGPWCAGPTMTWVCWGCVKQSDSK